MASITVKKVKGKEYVYFIYRDPSSNKKKEVYCGPAKDPNSAIKARQYEKSFNEATVDNLNKSVVISKKINPPGYIENDGPEEGGFIQAQIAAANNPETEPMVYGIEFQNIPEPTPLFHDILVKDQQEQQQAEQKGEQFRGAATTESSTPTGANTNPLANYVNANLLSEQKMKVKFPYAVPVYPVLDQGYLARLHDSARRDGSSRHAIEFYILFILGNRTKLIPDLNRIFMNKQREKEELEKLNQNTFYQDIIDELAGIDEDVGLRATQEDLLYQGFSYGRAVQIPNYGKEGLPENILQLSSFRLQEVWIDKRNGKFIGVKYEDFKENNIILEKDCLHYEVNRYNVTPNQMWFGMPVLEPINTIIESNRITNEIALPEASKRNYSPLQIIEIPSANTKEKLREVRSQIKPAQTYVTNTPTKVTDVKLNVDLSGLINLTTERDKKIYRDVGIPQIVGFQETQNRATAQYDLQQWTASSLQKKRTDLRDLYENQWYARNIAILLGDKYSKQFKKDVAKTMTNKNIPKRNLNEELPSVKNINQLYLQAGIKKGDVSISSKFKITDLTTEVWNKVRKALPFKVKMEFDNITFDNFVDKAAAAIALVQAGGLTWEFALELIGLTQYVDKMKEVWIEKERQEMLMFNQERAMMKQQLDNQGKLQKQTDDDNKQQLLGKRVGQKNINAKVGKQQANVSEVGPEAINRKFNRKTSLSANSANL